MKTLIITHLTVDEQADLVESHLERQGVECFRLCTNDFRRVSLKYDGITDKPTIRVGATTFIPDSIWYATHPRPDTLFATAFNYPGEHRKSASQFLVDIDSIFSGKSRFLPGQLDSISGADSKLALFQKARNNGLEVPAVTINSSGLNKREFKNQTWYRKALGFPSVITFSREDSKEVVTTATNSLQSANTEPGLWQWQTPIESIAHIRCCVVGDFVKAVMWRRESSIEQICDYRSYQNETGDDVWVEYHLPESVRAGLLKVKSALKVELCCPEFLLRDDGSHVFIDMNPCGDWIGFFDQKTASAIASEIAQLLVRRSS